MSQALPGLRVPQDRPGSLGLRVQPVLPALTASQDWTDLQDPQESPAPRVPRGLPDLLDQPELPGLRESPDLPGSKVSQVSMDIKASLVLLGQPDLRESLVLRASPVRPGLPARPG